MSSTNISSGRARFIGLWVLILAGAWGTLAASSLHASMSYNPLGLLAPGLQSSMILPQGWKFFTKDAQAARLRVFQASPGGWTIIDKGANAEPVNLFGLSKAPRAQSAEIGALTKSLPSSAWHECREAPQRCLEQSSQPYALTSRFPTPTLCGRLGIVSQKPVPWAWAPREGRFDMPSLVATLEVSC